MRLRYFNHIPDCRSLLKSEGRSAESSDLVVLEAGLRLAIVSVVIIWPRFQ